MITRRALIAGMAGLAAAPRPGWAAPTPDDPLQSVNWDLMREEFLGDTPFVFDDAVAMVAPTSAEDAMQVPFLIDATRLPRALRILVFADLNPINRILDFKPGRLAPVLAARFKIQQATPLRAAALDGQGLWHVGGQWIDAMGGGCTAPALAHGEADWTARLGETSVRVFDREGRKRIRLQIRHPMDTGLAAGIPAFFIEQLVLTDEKGEVLGELATSEPVSENPLFTFELPTALGLSEIGIRARDNNGNVFTRKVTL